MTSKRRATTDGLDYVRTAAVKISKCKIVSAATSARTHTLPDESGTLIVDSVSNGYMTTDTNQDVTGVKTFSSADGTPRLKISSAADPAVAVGLNYGGVFNPVYSFPSANVTDTVLIAFVAQDMGNKTIESSKFGANGTVLNTVRTGSVAIGAGGPNLSLNVTHGLGSAPTWVSATINKNAQVNTDMLIANVVSFNATTITFLINRTDSPGSGWGNPDYRLFWEARN